ncbi:unnamed protein product [Lasius platythorax]|uniref:Uncharacterized protein n=1 Tax=Lasius platythorax TaxID=488582 RepID=A0AAV2NBQ4_9HYME
MIANIGANEIAILGFVEANMAVRLKFSRCTSQGEEAAYSFFIHQSAEEMIGRSQQSATFRGLSTRSEFRIPVCLFGIKWLGEFRILRSAPLTISGKSVPAPLLLNHRWTKKEEESTEVR